MNDAAFFEQAAEWIRHADGLLITAGAGMGVDSGLPDYRGVAASRIFVRGDGESRGLRSTSAARVGLLRASARAVSRDRAA
jgi:hypothetical protein